MHLMPMMISASAVYEDFEKAEKYDALDCMSCGCCSFICPAKKPIAQNIKFAKEMIMANRRKEQAKKKAEEQRSQKAEQPQAGEAK